MNIVKWNPFRELDEMQARLNRMLNESPDRTNEPFAFADWAPAVDIQETDTAYSVKADLPEVKKEDIKIELHDGVLSMKASAGKKRKKRERNFTASSASAGNSSGASFCRMRWTPRR